MLKFHLQMPRQSKSQAKIYNGRSGIREVLSGLEVQFSSPNPVFNLSHRETI
jgi:hypothetical protein